MTRRYFGTDGVRGRVGEEPITPEFAMRLGYAAGRVLAGDQRDAQVVMGKDTRLSGYLLESAMEAGFAAAGVGVRLLGPMPTPAIAYLTRAFQAQAGVVISASHNPYYDNGIKFFAGNGRKLPDEVERSIEQMLDQPIRTVAPERIGRAFRQEDARGRYIEFCKASFPNQFSLRGLRVVVDCAHGATYQVAPNVYSELGAEVFRIGVSPDGLNINEDCGATSPQALVNAVRTHRADVGIALDGDGDRLIMVDSAGDIVDGDELLLMIARERLDQGVVLGGVVGTLMSNLALEIALGELGLEFVRAKVGDRYVMAELERHGWVLGGESSGHIVCLDKTSTGDAIIASLQVLARLVRLQTTLLCERAKLQKFPQVMINVRVSGAGDPLQHPDLKVAQKAVETELGARGRVLLRASGTEPLIRVMVEGEDGLLVQRCAEQLSETVRRCMSTGSAAERP